MIIKRFIAILLCLLIASPAWAATPTITSSTSSLTDTGSTSVVVTLPATVNAGERLLAFVAADGAGSFTWPVGWDEVYDGSTTDECHLTVGTKIADGTEDGTTITVTASGSDKAAHQSFSIAGHDSAILPEAAAEAESLDPGTVTPTGGVKDYLFFAAACIDGGANITVAPTDYGDLVFNETSAGSATGLGTARRALNATSSNPDAFSQSGAEGGNSTVVAVHPAAAASVIPTSPIFFQ